jgi:hypothetical protein
VEFSGNSQIIAQSDFKYFGEMQTMKIIISSSIINSTFNKLRLLYRKLLFFSLCKLAPGLSLKNPLLLFSATSEFFLYNFSLINHHSSTTTLHPFKLLP